MPARSTTAAGHAPLWPVLAVLFVTGWATNHFVGLIPLLHEREHIPLTGLDAAFGIYALGLLPSLLTGGGLSDRFGRAPIVLTGAAVAAAGNLMMLFWHTSPGVLSGRFVVGLGVGWAISAGTAWATDLGGARGAVLSGIYLTAGFGIGPLGAGLVALASGRAVLVTPFAVTVVLSLAAVATALVVERGASRPTPAAPSPEPGTGSGRRGGAPATAVARDELPSAHRSLGRALAASLPMALWVFSTISVCVVTMASRLSDFSGPLVPGVAALLSLGTGTGIQVLARRGDWGPRSGVAGALCAAAGFTLVALGRDDPHAGLFLAAALLLGCAYGLCLRNGLMDVERLGPPAQRGLLSGIYYVGTYLGFGLPLTLRLLAPSFGLVAPVLILVAVALACAAIRAAQLRTGLVAR